MKAGKYINKFQCSICGSRNTEHTGDNKRFVRFCLDCGGIEIKGATIKGETVKQFKKRAIMS